MTAEEREQEDREVKECLRRIPAALELIAARLERPNPDRALLSRVATLEELVKDVIALIDNVQSTDAEWTDLLAVLKEAVA